MDQSNIDLRSKYRSITLVRESYAADVRLAYDRRTIRVRPTGTRLARGWQTAGTRLTIGWKSPDQGSTDTMHSHYLGTAKAGTRYGNTV